LKRGISKIKRTKVFIKKHVTTLGRKKRRKNFHGREIGRPALTLLDYAKEIKGSRSKKEKKDPWKHVQAGGGSLSRGKERRDAKKRRNRRKENGDKKEMPGTFTHSRKFGGPGFKI